jgi:hypothetical protein
LRGEQCSTDTERSRPQHWSILALLFLVRLGGFEFDRDGLEYPFGKEPWTVLNVGVMIEGITLRATAAPFGTR